MKISQSVASTLLVAITEAIQHGTATHYRTYEFPRDWERKTLDALGEDFEKALVRNLDGSTLDLFIRDQLYLKALKTKTAPPAKDTQIVKLKCFNDPLQTAREIVENLEKLPIRYRVLVRVCNELAVRVNRSDISIELSDRLRLLSGAAMPGSFKTSHADANLDSYIKAHGASRDADIEITDNALYLEYRTSGYMSSRRTARTTGEFYDEVRAFYGACIAHRILSTFGYIGDDIAPLMIANSILDETEEFALVARPEEDITRCANLSTSVETDKKIKGKTSVEKLLLPILPVFKSSNSNRLKTACAWALRGHLSTRSLDRVLESTITIEVLMGDREASDRVGLSKLMANRCAYALGRSNKERDDIIEFFSQFYKLRSEVVHSGRTTLHSDERKIVNKGLELATRILNHEIALAT